MRGGKYFKARSSWIQPYFGFKQLKPPKMPFFGSFCLFDTLQTNSLTRDNMIFSARYYSVKLGFKYKVVGMGYM